MLRLLPMLLDQSRPVFLRLGDIPFEVLIERFQNGLVEVEIQFAVPDLPGINNIDGEQGVHRYAVRTEAAALRQVFFRGCIKQILMLLAREKVCGAVVARGNTWISVYRL